MFGWWKNRLLNELKKLVFQNSEAVYSLRTLFQSNRQIEHVLTMCRFEEEISRVAEAFDGKIPLSQADLSKMLDINSELRKIDHFIYQSVTHFDETYQPVIGWDRYCKTH
jgi:hypothetical protein